MIWHLTKTGHRPKDDADVICISSKEAFRAYHSREDDSFYPSHSKRYYIIQAFVDEQWKDVLLSNGNLKTAQKKARHYRNQNGCETRVVEVTENVSYSYGYKLVKG
jgi:hypothetical protein